MFKLSAIKVEETLRGDLPLAEYSKLVLCRTCPASFGAQFTVVADDSTKGELLKLIFIGDSTQKVRFKTKFTYQKQLCLISNLMLIVFPYLLMLILE